MTRCVCTHAGAVMLLCDVSVFSLTNGKGQTFNYMHSVQGFCLQLKLGFSRFHSRECILEALRYLLPCTSAFVLSPVWTISLLSHNYEHWDFDVYLELSIIAVYSFIIVQLNTIIYRQVFISLFDSSRYLSWTVFLGQRFFRTSCFFNRPIFGLLQTIWIVRLHFLAQ